MFVIKDLFKECCVKSLVYIDGILKLLRINIIYLDFGLGEVDLFCFVCLL